MGAPLSMDDRQTIQKMWNDNKSLAEIAKAFPETSKYHLRLVLGIKRRPNAHRWGKRSC